MDPSLHTYSLRQIRKYNSWAIAVKSPSKKWWKIVRSQKSCVLQCQQTNIKTHTQSYNTHTYVYRKSSQVPGVQVSVRIFFYHVYSLRKLILLSLENPDSSINKSKDGNAGLLAHFLRSHSQKNSSL